MGLEYLSLNKVIGSCYWGWTNRISNNSMAEVFWGKHIVVTEISEERKNG